jgi:ABC-type Na+ efflux pump permease subunit
MNNIRLVMSTGNKNVLRMKTVIVVMIPVLLICVVGVALLLCLLAIGPEMAKASPDRAILGSYLGLTVYASAFITIGITLNSTIFQTMVREKARGNLAALLATPLEVTDIWVGKSLALFIPGLVLTIVLAVLSWFIVNVIYFVPDFGFIINWQMVVNSLIAVPLMYLLFGLLVHLIGFITKPATGNIIAQVFLPVMMNLAAQLVVRGVMDANSWQFMLMNFGVAIACGVAILAVKPKLVKEKIILSS